MSDQVSVANASRLAELHEQDASAGILPGAQQMRWLAQRLGIIGTPLILPAIIGALWYLSASRGWISELILPAPAVAWDSFRELWADGTVLNNIAISAQRIGIGFSLGTVIGLVLGVLLALSSTFRIYVRPTFLSLAQIPVLAWVPILILTVGTEERLKVVGIAIATLVPVTINTAQGIANISPRWFELARVYQLNRWQTLRGIAFPAALPTLFVGVRSGLSEAWASLIIVELVASSEGLGFMVSWGRQLFQLEIVVVSIIIIGLIGLSLDRSLEWVGHRLQRHRQP